LTIFHPPSSIDLSIFPYISIMLFHTICIFSSSYNLYSPYYSFISPYYSIYSSSHPSLHLYSSFPILFLSMTLLYLTPSSILPSITLPSSISFYLIHPSIHLFSSLPIQTIISSLSTISIFSICLHSLSLTLSLSLLISP